MQLSFDAQTGLSAPDTGDIRDAVAQDWVSAFNSDDGSPALDTESATPAGQLIDSETALLAEANSDMLLLMNQFNPKTAEGIWQDAIGAIYGMTRQLASPTVVSVTCTGLYGTSIPAGSIVQDTSGYQYASSDAAVIPSGGSVTVQFQNTQSGAIACAAHAITKIITVIPGWDAVDNAVAGTGGSEAETRAEYEARRQALLAANGRGSINALLAALSAVDGVTDAMVLENDTAAAKTMKGISVAAHSVACCVYGGTGTDIAEALYLKKSAGCATTGSTTVTYTDETVGQTYTYSIVRPTATSVKFAVSIDGSVTNPQDVVQRIKNAIVNDFAGSGDNARVGLGMTVYASRFSAVITGAGVAGVLSVTIGYATASMDTSLVINADIEPVCAASDVTVTVVS